MLTSRYNPYFDFYVVDPAILYQLAVYITLQAKFISHDVLLLLAWVIILAISKFLVAYEFSTSIQQKLPSTNDFSGLLIST